MSKWRLHQPLTPDGYQEVRDNFTWFDHKYRTYLTAGAVALTQPLSLIDPACGDGYIYYFADKLWSISTADLNDISLNQVEYNRRFFEGNDRVQFSHMDALDFMSTADRYDTVLLTEILEHLEEPEKLLEAASHKAKWLVASSPIGEHTTTNHEHVWGWDEDGYYDMLAASGWTPKTVVKQYMNHMALPYNFMIWTAESKNITT